MTAPIKAGDRFICIKGVVKNDSRKQPSYHFGEEYRSDQDGCITNCDGNIDHMWHPNDRPGEFFQRLDADVRQEKFREDLDAREADLVMNNSIGNHKSFLMP